MTDPELFPCTLELSLLPADQLCQKCGCLAREHLSYRPADGTNPSAPRKPPSQWVSVTLDREVREGEPITINEVRAAVMRAVNPLIGRPLAFEGQKHDTGKPRFDLLPPHALEQVARVLEYGARKYAPDNWRKVPDARARYLAAALRHTNAFAKGETVDHESGLPHLAHAACCLMFLIELDQ